MSVDWQVGDFYRATDDLVDRADDAMRQWVVEGTAMIERQFKLNASGRPGPNVVTGQHRASFTSTGPNHDGPGRWSSSMGPTMVYSRALELSHPRWRSRAKYPALGPAVEYFRRVGAGAVMAQVARRITRG